MHEVEPGQIGEPDGRWGEAPQEGVFVSHCRTSVSHGRAGGSGTSGGASPRRPTARHSRIRFGTAVPALVAALALGSGAAAQETTGPSPAPGGEGGAVRAIVAGRYAGAPPVVDGRLDDPAWELASPSTGFVQRQPNPGAPASRETQIRVLQAGGALYVAARMYDHPDSVAAQLARRDATGIYSDWLYVMVDSDDDNRTAFGFAINPREVKQDFVLTENGRRDLKWNAVWEGRAAVDSLGWTAEFRIPLSQLRFSRGATTWGVNFEREIARHEEVSYWAPIPPDAPGYVSRFGELQGLSDLGPATRLELEPYAVSSLTRAPGDRSNPFYSASDVRAAAGLDFRYGLTPSLTLTGTVNPDFGQVEADPSEVNLTAFETQLTEQRPFFVEGADIFDFGFGGQAGQLFYSRRIGAPPSGTVPGDATFRDVPERTTILGAVKLSGKTADGWSVGLLNALNGREEAAFVSPTDGTRRLVVEPLTNYGVARVIRDFRRGSSGLGGVLTSVNRDLAGTGLDFLRTAAYAGGIDGWHRFGGGNYQLGGFMVGSHVRGSEDALRDVQLHSAHYFQRPDAAHLEFDSTRTSLSGFIGNLEVEKIGGGRWRWELGARTRSPGLEINDLGFQQQTDRVEEYAGVGFQEFRPGRHFRNWSVNLFERVEWTFGGERVGARGNLSGTFQLNNFWGGSGTVERAMPALSTAALRGGPALRLPGQTNVYLGFYSDRRERVSGTLSLTAEVHDEMDGRLLSVAPSVEIRPSPRIHLSLRPSLSRLENPAQYVTSRRLDDGSVRYVLARLGQTTAALTARLSYTFTPDLSLQWYAQPYISAGEYSDFVEVVDPGGRSYSERFRPVAAPQDPDFNFKQLRSNAVLRWEYRPGSALFVIWNNALHHDAPDGTFDLSRDAGRLFRAEGTNVLLLKVSYWFGV